MIMLAAYVAQAREEEFRRLVLESYNFTAKIRWNQKTVTRKDGTQVVMPVLPDDYKAEFHR